MLRITRANLTLDCMALPNVKCLLLRKNTVVWKCVMDLNKPRARELVGQRNKQTIVMYMSLYTRFYLMHHCLSERTCLSQNFAMSSRTSSNCKYTAYPSGQSNTQTHTQTHTRTRAHTRTHIRTHTRTHAYNMQNVLYTRRC